MDTARSGWDHFLHYSDWLMLLGPEDLLIRVFACLHMHCILPRSSLRATEPVSTRFTLPCRGSIRTLSLYGLTVAFFQRINDMNAMNDSIATLGHIIICLSPFYLNSIGEAVPYYLGKPRVLIL